MYLVRKNFRFIFSFKNKKKFQKLKNVYRYKIQKLNYIFIPRSYINRSCYMYV